MNKSNIANLMKKYTMVLALLVVVLFFTIQSGGKILLPQNVTNLIAQNAYVFVLASGMLLCILTGGNIDLSVGSVVCFVGAIGAVLLESLGFSLGITVFIMLVIGTLIGALQGYWIAYVRVPPFIVTLAGMLIFRGLSNVVLDGQTVSIKNKTFIRIFGGGANCYIPDIFQGESLNITCIIVGILVVLGYIIYVIKTLYRKKKNGESISIYSCIGKTILICGLIILLTLRLAQYKGIPTSLIWVIVVVSIYAYITSKTTIGRHFYAVGGNEKATKMSGINTDRVFFLAYTNMGLLAGLAGMLTIARMSSAQPTYGQNYEMDAIASCFIGGASAYGGIGTIPGVIIGAVLMGVINLGMSIMGVDSNYQRVVKGLVLLIAVIFDVVSKKQKRK